MSKPSYNKHSDAVTEDLEKYLPKVPFITTITQKVHRRNYAEKATSHKVTNGFTVDLMCYRYYQPSPLPPFQHYAHLLESLFWVHRWQDENYFQLLCQTERNYLLLLCVYVLYYNPLRNVYLQVLREMRLTNFLIVKQNRHIFFINAWINFNLYIKEIRETSQLIICSGKLQC